MTSNVKHNVFTEARDSIINEMLKMCAQDFVLSLKLSTLTVLTGYCR